MRGQPNLEIRQTILRLRLEEGLTFKAISAAVGVTPQRVQQLIAPSKSLVAIIVARADGCCESCTVPVSGRTGHIHHHVAKGMTPDTYNSEPNLTLLCISCHRKAHAKPELTAKWAELRRLRTPEEKAVNIVARAIKLGAKRLGISEETYAECRAAGLRWCSGHRDWLDISVFPKSRRTASGLGENCHECNRQTAQRQYESGYRKRYVEKNREKVNAYHREWQRKRRAALKASA